MPYPALTLPLCLPLLLPPAYCKRKPSSHCRALYGPRLALQDGSTTLTCLAWSEGVLVQKQKNKKVKKPKIRNPQNWDETALFIFDFKKLAVLFSAELIDRFVFLSQSWLWSLIGNRFWKFHCQTRIFAINLRRRHYDIAGICSFSSCTGYRYVHP